MWKRTGRIASVISVVVPVLVMLVVATAFILTPIPACCEGASSEVQSTESSGTITMSIDKWVVGTVAVVAGFLGGLTVIFSFLAKTIKPIREWMIRRARKALRVLDIEKFMTDNFERLENA